MVQDNNFLDFLKSRRSVRQFDQTREVAPEVLQQIILAGVAAPSAKNNQPRRFYHLRSEEAKEKIKRCYTKEWFQHAKEYILFVGEDDACWTYHDGLATSMYIDGAIACTQMMLEAWAMGVGSTWVCDFDRDLCCELLGFEMGKSTPLQILALGYPASDPSELPYRRKALDELFFTL